MVKLGFIGFGEAAFKKSYYLHHLLLAYAIGTLLLGME